MTDHRNKFCTASLPDTQWKKQNTELEQRITGQWGWHANQCRKDGLIRLMLEWIKRRRETNVAACSIHGPTLCQSVEVGSHRQLNLANKTAKHRVRAGMCWMKLEYLVITKCEKVLSCQEDTDVGRKGSFYRPYLGQFEDTQKYGCKAWGLWRIWEACILR